MDDYCIVEKEKSEFQKLLNQWKHQFDIEIIWMDYLSDNKYRALIKRKERE